MLAYAIKSAIFLSMMYIPYMLMLRKEAFFHFNRILLVSIMLLSLILPLCDFHFLSIANNPIQEGMIIIGTPTAVMENGGNATISEDINWFAIVFYIYIIGMAATFIWKMVQLAVLYGTIHRGVLWKDEQYGITIYCHAQDIAPFSWLNSIVISEDDYNNNATEILRHEMGHIELHFDKDSVFVDDDITIAEKSSDEKEQEANYFAACLLMPSEDIEKFIDVEINYDKSRLTTLDIARIMSEFNVSFDMVLNRLQSLDIIDENQKISLDSEKIEKNLLHSVGGNAKLNIAYNEIDIPCEYMEYAIYNYNHRAIPKETLEKVLECYNLCIDDVSDKLVEHHEENEDIDDLIGGLLD